MKYFSLIKCFMPCVEAKPPVSHSHGARLGRDGAAADTAGSRAGFAAAAQFSPGLADAVRKQMGRSRAEAYV